MSVDITNQSSTESGWKFIVQTDEGTKHTVTVPADYHQKVTNEKVSPRDFVTQSFEFLLDREPAHAIFTEFGLPIIEDYFPEYPEKITNLGSHK